MNDAELLTVEEAARVLGTSTEETRRLVLSGRLSHLLVAGADGGLEVRLERSSVAGCATGAGAEEPAARARDEDAAPAASGPSPEHALTVAPEVRDLAAGLADELFQRWQLAMETQFRQELAVRLQSELKHRERTVEDLREEVTEREEERFGAGGRRVRGMTD